jgi:hypothetical protein
MFTWNPLQYYRNRQIKNLVERTWEDNKYTPDAGELESQWRHSVFICDDFMRNRPRYNEQGLKEYTQYRGRGFTDALFNGYWHLAEKRALFFPNSREALQPDWSDQTSAHPVQVLGEVHLLPTGILKELDKQMKNGYDFIRTTVTIKIWCQRTLWTPWGQHIPQQRGRFKKTDHGYGTHVRMPLTPRRVEAWMYIANPDKWIPDNGYEYKPLHIFKAKNGLEPNRFVFHSLRRIPSHS